MLAGVELLGAELVGAELLGVASDFLAGSLDLDSPDLLSPDLVSPDLLSPDLVSPDLLSPDLAVLVAESLFLSRESVRVTANRAVSQCGIGNRLHDLVVGGTGRTRIFIRGHGSSD